MKRDHGGLSARIDASVNVNPLGPPAVLDDAFARARELSSRYPEIDVFSARQAWAKRLGVAAECLLIGNGASELISLVIRIMLPKRIIVFDPCYSEYEAAAQAVGVPVVHIPLELHRSARPMLPDVQPMPPTRLPAPHTLPITQPIPPDTPPVLPTTAPMSPDTPLVSLGTWSTPLGTLEVGPGDLVVICQPNNPTGHLTDPTAITALAERGADVLVDESFLALTSVHATCSLVGCVSHAGGQGGPGEPGKQHKKPGGRLSVVTSLTKTYCVPGLRLGLLAADPGLISRISGIRDPWSVNAIAAEAATVLASGCGDYLERSRRLLAAERTHLTSAIAALRGVRVTASEGPFLLAELPEGLVAAELRDRLLTRGVGVRDASTFAGLSERWLRIGIRSPAENDAIIAAITAEFAPEPLVAPIALKPAAEPAVVPTVAEPAGEP
ncbi:MAG: aminotransferase class I/II-fold pyridoxal phosphate-dependent enzyme [Coriobacteriia bacterium]|nr:aminotransferase class I/II-fold pyridoxal phosphate-dependent enzyme [Coriobacteriia bacterium]